MLYLGINLFVLRDSGCGKVLGFTIVFKYYFKIYGEFVRVEEFLEI